MESQELFNFRNSNPPPSCQGALIQNLFVFTSNISLGRWCSNQLHSFMPHPSCFHYSRLHRIFSIVDNMMRSYISTSLGSYIYSVDLHAPSTPYDHTTLRLTCRATEWWWKQQVAVCRWRSLVIVHRNYKYPVTCQTEPSDACSGIEWRSQRN